MNLQGRIALVTGGARGIGHGIARHLILAGATVVVADLQIDEVKDTIRSEGEASFALQADVTNEDEVSRLIQTVIERLGHLDILVNNVGTGQQVVWTADLELAEWQRIIAINLTSTFLCSKYAARQMMLQGNGRIISVASINSLGAFPLVAAYNAAKWGVIGLTKTLANELGPYHITVNAICPGPVNTDFQRSNIAQRSAILGIQEESYHDRIIQQTPLRRWTTPDDIGACATFLASDAASNMTGVVMPVTGGMDILGGTPPAWSGAPFPAEVR